MIIKDGKEIQLDESCSQTVITTRQHAYSRETQDTVIRNGGEIHVPFSLFCEMEGVKMV
jgi:hypothetical protein